MGYFYRNCALLFRWVQRLLDSYKFLFLQHSVLFDIIVNTSLTFSNQMLIEIFSCLTQTVTHIYALYAPASVGMTLCDPIMGHYI